MKSLQRHRHGSQLAFIEHLLCARACGKHLACIIIFKLAYSNPIIMLILRINESQRGYQTSKFTQLTCGQARIKTQITDVSTSSSPTARVLRLGRGFGRRVGYTTTTGSYNDGSSNISKYSISAKISSLVLPLDPIPSGLA